MKSIDAVNQINKEQDVRIKATIFANLIRKQIQEIIKIRNIKLMTAFDSLRDEINQWANSVIEKGELKSIFKQDVGRMIFNKMLNEASGLTETIKPTSESNEAAKSNPG